MPPTILTPNPKTFVLLEPLLTESLQEYFARHGLKLHVPSDHNAAALERWRAGAAWAQGAIDWRTREQRRQDSIRAQDFDDAYHNEAK